MRLSTAVIAVLVCGTRAQASTVIPLSAAELESGADRIVDATVVARRTVWNATRTGLETHAMLAVDQSHKGPPTAVLEVVVPGGELDGARHIVFGTPALAFGEHARWFLRDLPDTTARVYGWAQGKWPAKIVDGRTVFLPAPIVAEHDTSVAAFATNGMIWPAAKIPVSYVIQNAGGQDLTLADEIAAFDAAFATWQAVPTASLAFTNAGMTDLGLAVDSTNVMMFVETGWVFGSEAAAATSLYIIDGLQTADIAVNGQNFHWAIGPPNASVTANTLDLQAVLTHEIGHFSGLGHTLRAFDTMYYSWKPWQGQRTLSIDDKLGLTSIYPIAGDECGSCPATESCLAFPQGHLCAGTPDPIGTPCSYDRVECDAFCLFTTTTLAAGYCSKFCVRDADCPLTHHCGDAASGSMPVKVCFIGAQPPPPPGCTADPECPAGEHCDAANGACTFECRTSADCSGDTSCDERGTCAASQGCAAGGGDSTLGFGLIALLVAARRRRVAAWSRRGAAIGPDA